MSLLQARASGNHALTSNPPIAPIDITTRGSDWLWTVFTIMALSTILMTFWRHARIPGTRLFHDLAIIILATSSIAYFAMASDLGATPIAVEFLRGSPAGSTRAIWYVRYIQWFINFPLLLLILLRSRLPPTSPSTSASTSTTASSIILPLFFADFAVVSGLIGALVHSTYKWGFYTFAVIALFYIIFNIFSSPTSSSPSTSTSFSPSTKQPSSKFHFLRPFTTTTTTSSSSFSSPSTLPTHILLSLLLILYPISWALSEGSNKIAPDSEMVFYGILDLVAGPGLVFWVVWRFVGAGVGAGVNGVNGAGEKSAPVNGAGTTTATATAPTTTV